jgi:hypothetical protein
LPLEFLIGNVLLSGLLSNFRNVTLNVSDPLARVVSSLLANSLLLVYSPGSFSHQSCVRVKHVKSLGVSEGVGGLQLMENSVASGAPNSSLNFIGVDDAGDIGVSNLVSGEGPALLLRTSLLVGSEDVVKLLECTFGPDDKSSDVSSGGKLKEVKPANVSDLNSRNVSESLDQRDIGTTVDDQRSSSASDLDSVNNLLDISPSSGVLEESDGLSGAFDLFGSIRDDKGQLGDGIDSVSSSLDKREDS